MATQPIDRPGELVESKSFSDLLELNEDSPAALQWRQQMQDIDQSQRSAENDSASVRIR
ncbi:MAG: hypothetical protein NVSMB48_13080 [Marmoricola sp.]